MGLQPVGPPPLQLLAFWQVLWPMIHQDIINNSNPTSNRWAVSRRNRTLVRGPVFQIPAHLGSLWPFQNLQLPQYHNMVRIVVRLVTQSAPPPHRDNQDRYVLDGQITVPPPLIVYALGGNQAGWNDINGIIVP